MAGVPQTETSLDKLEERRKLNLEIVGLTQAKDRAKIVADDAEKAATEATARAKAAKEHLDALEVSMNGSSAEIREFVAHCRNVLHTAVLCMEEVAQYARDMQKKVDDLAEEITKAQTALDALRETIAKENTAMSQTRDDLDIYKERILTAAQSVGIKVKL